MNLFSDLEGLSGEGLATAGLRLLLLRSPGCKEAFVQELDALSPFGPLLSNSHFSCYTEHPTHDEREGSGRLDLCIELDDVVVGIEVKLGALFQPSQPAKYEAELKRMAGVLTELRRQKVRHFLVVLAPERRRTEIARHLGRGQAMLSWETVLESLGSASGGDPFVEVLIDEYSRFLRDHLHFLPGFSEWAHHLTASWKKKGTDYQKDFLYRLVSLLPNPTRMGSGPDWVGYYFTAAGDDGIRSWIGFVPAKRAEPGRSATGSRLVVAGPRSPETAAKCRPMASGKTIWIDGVHQPGWIIDFEPSWDQPEVWAEVLEVFVGER